MVIVIRGQRYWLWRAVDNEGEVLDFLVQSKRNAQAALKLMRKLLKETRLDTHPDHNQTFGQNAVHGSNRAQVSPFVQQLRPYGGRSFVDKLSAVQDLHNGFPFGRAQGAWGCGPRPINSGPITSPFEPSA